MKKYYFAAQKKQLEKPTESAYMYCAKARVWVIAEDEAEATALAVKKFAEKYCGVGVVLGQPELTKCVDLPVDWSYGYGDDRQSGDTASITDLVGNNIIR